MENEVNVGDLVEMDVNELLKEDVENSNAGRFLSNKLIKEKAIKKILVKSIGKAYKKSFPPDTELKSFLDLNVIVQTEGELKGKEMTFSLNMTNRNKMMELYGKPDAWSGKIIRLTIIKTNKGDSAVIDSD